MIKLKVSKEELLQWYADNKVPVAPKQIRDYNSDDWGGFIGYSNITSTEKRCSKNTLKK